MLLNPLKKLKLHIILLLLGMVFKQHLPLSMCEGYVQSISCSDTLLQHDVLSPALSFLRL